MHADAIAISGPQRDPRWLTAYRAGTTEDWSWSSGYIEGKAALHGYSAARPREAGKPRDAAEPSAVPLRSTAPVSAAEHCGQGRVVSRLHTEEGSASDAA